MSATKTPEEIRAIWRGYERTYREKHREKFNLAKRERARRRRARMTPEEVTAVRAYKLAWYRSHKQHAKDYYQKNRVKILTRVRAASALQSKQVKSERVKRHYRKYPERKAEHARRRRATKSGCAVNRKGIEAWMVRVKSDGTLCYYCKRPIAGSTIHFDHIQPIARGGKHSLDNLCASCASCNRTKHVKPLSEIRITAQQFLSL